MPGVLLPPAAGLIQTTLPATGIRVEIVQQSQDQVDVVAELIGTRGRHEDAAILQIRHVRGVERGLFLDRQGQDRGTHSRLLVLLPRLHRCVVHQAFNVPCRVSVPDAIASM